MKKNDKKYNKNRKEKHKTKKYIYVVYSKVLDKTVKVGVSSNPEKRIKQLSNGIPEDYVIIALLVIPEGITDVDFLKFLEQKYPICRVIKNGNNGNYKTEFINLDVVDIENIIFELLLFSKAKNIRAQLTVNWEFESKNSPVNISNNSVKNDIKKYAKENGVLLWEIARCLNKRDDQFSRDLRKEISKEEKEAIFSIIDSIAKERSKYND